MACEARQAHYHPPTPHHLTPPVSLPPPTTSPLPPPRAGYLSEVQQLAGPFLVIVPLSTVPNWIREFRKWVPQINAIVYVGDARSREVSAGVGVGGGVGGVGWISKALLAHARACTSSAFSPAHPLPRADHAHV